MKRKMIYLLLGFVAAVSISGCGQNEEETEFSTSDPEETAEEDMDLSALDEETEEEASLEPITPSDYLVQDTADYVVLGDYEGIAVEQYTYEVTDEMVQDEIQQYLEMSGEEVETDSPSESGNIVYFTMTYSTPGSDPYEESTYITLGLEEYGSEFDENLTGVSAGDTLEFSISFDDSIWIEEWMDQTVDFEVSVESVCTLDVPEYDDTYAESMGYTSTEEYESAVRESLIASYEDLSYSDAAESLILAAVDRTEFSGYPEDLYEACKEETESYYLMFTDGDSIEDIYDIFGITEEDLESEILSTVNRRLFISAYCAENDITVTEDEYVEYLNALADSYGYESAVAAEEDYTREAVVWAAYESKVTDLLFESAEITEVPYSEDEEGVVIEEEDLGEEIVDETETDLSETAEAASESTSESTAETAAEETSPVTEETAEP